MTNFNSLPRELRDQIYSQVLVSTLPIQFSNVLGPMVCDPDLIAPMAILFAWASSQRIADEACEIFYQRNTFLVYCEDLPTFLEGKIHKMLSIDVGPLIHNQGTTFRRSFDTREWVANIDVIIEQNTTNYSRYLAYELQYLLRCPRLRNLTIKTGRNAVMSWEKEWTGVLKELQLKAALSSPPFGEVAMIMKEMSRILEKDLAREAENDATPKYWAFAALLVLVLFPKSTDPQTVNVVKSSPTSFASLSRELRDQIYRHIVVAEDEPIAITSRATDYGNGEGIKAIRAILHSSDSWYSTAWFAREAYEVYFRENVFQVRCDNLPEFLTRKSLYLKNEGFFSIGAWVGRLDVIIPISAYPHINRDTDKRDKLINELGLSTSAHNEPADRTR